MLIASPCGYFCRTAAETTPEPGKAAETIRLHKHSQEHAQRLKGEVNVVQNPCCHECSRAETDKIVKSFILHYMPDQTGLVGCLINPNFCFEFRACSLLAPSNSELSARSHPRFGARYTSKALADLGLSTSDPSWHPMAQQLTRQALRTRKWQRKNAGVWPARASAQMLVVWCSYEIYDESGLVCENKGKLFFSAKTDATEVDSARGLSELLLASVFVEHDRSMHAERHALLEVANLVERMGSRDVHGNVRLYAVHTPCISCLAVFCQFRSLFPQVVLHVQFDDWSATRQALVEMGGRHASFASPAGSLHEEISRRRLRMNKTKRSTIRPRACDVIVIETVGMNSKQVGKLT